VIKAQVLAGGRGKGHFDSGFKGGVHMVDSYVTPLLPTVSSSLTVPLFPYRLSAHNPLIHARPRISPYPHDPFIPARPRILPHAHKPFIPHRPHILSHPHSPAQAKEYAEKMLGHKLITKQTGAEGRVCNAVMLAQRMPPQKEYYAAILNDRARGCPVLVTSNQGGMNIEDVAHDTPEAIITTSLDFESGISSQEGLDLAKKLGFKEGAQKNAADVFSKLYKIFKEKDATQIEINPLAELSNGQVLW
jgi:succinyl-CoA synthetase beta subunit